MWPSTRFQWPPPCSVRRGWGVGLEGIRSRVRRSAGLQGSRRPRDREGQSPGHGSGGAEPVNRRSKSWRTGCSSSTVPNSPWARHWSLHCAGMGPHQRGRCSPGHRKASRRDHVPRASWAQWPHQTGCPVRGRWSDESAQFVRQLAKAQARGEPPILRSGPNRRGHTSGRPSWLSHCRCWSVGVCLGVDGATPTTSDVIGDASHLCAWFPRGINPLRDGRYNTMRGNNRSSLQPPDCLTSSLNKRCGTDTLHGETSVDSSTD